MVRMLGTFASVILIAGSATATPSDDATQIEQTGEFQAAMDAAMAERMTPGPKQEGWNKGGVDIYRLVEAAPGGIAANHLLSVDKDGQRGVTIIRPRDLADVVPEHWKVIMHAGSSKELTGADTLVVGNIDGPFHFVGWENHRRVEDAFCSAGNIGGKLYEAAGQAAESKLPRDMVPSIFQAMASHLEKRPMCWRYDRHGEGFRISYFLEDGRTLPQLNESEDQVTIVRAAPIEQLLAKAAASK